MQTFDFDVTMDDLVDAEGIEGLNDILEDRLASQGIEGIPSDIDYAPVSLDIQGTAHMITIRATFELIE